MRKILSLMAMLSILIGLSGCGSSMTDEEKVFMKEHSARQILNQNNPKFVPKYYYEFIEEQIVRHITQRNEYIMKSNKEIDVQNSYGNEKKAHEELLDTNAILKHLAVHKDLIANFKPVNEQDSFSNFVRAKVQGLDFMLKLNMSLEGSPDMNNAPKTTQKIIDNEILPNLEITFKVEQTNYKNVSLYHAEYRLKDGSIKGTYSISQQVVNAAIKK
jgi:hypothetical protein